MTDSSSSEDEASAPKKIKYDHFDPSHTCTIQEVPVELKDHVAEIRTEPYSNFGSNIKRLTLLKILRQKLLEHKWGDAALIMEGLASQPLEKYVTLGHLFWKAGNEILYNHPGTCSESDLVHQHKQGVDTCGHYLDNTHVLFEYAMYHMVRKDFDAARQTLRYFRHVKFSGPLKEEVKASVEEWAPVIEGYLGMLDYISWKKAGYEQNTDSESEEGFEHQAVGNTFAEEALSHFETTFESPGVWDMFMKKYIEIMEHFGKITEAEETLRTNSLKNPKNPNAHKHWYQFLLKHPDIVENSDHRTQALSKLQEVAPSDLCMLDLHNLRMGAAFKMDVKNEQFVSMASMALEILLDMLDYESWINHEDAWQTLASSLKKVKRAIRKKKFNSILDIIWRSTMRDTWWPKYHFSRQRAVDAQSVIVRSKYLAAKVLLGRKCDFCVYLKSVWKNSSGFNESTSEFSE